MNNNHISQLKHDKSAQLDKQMVSLGKHRILAEIARRQEKKTTVKLSASEHVRLFVMRVARRLVPAQQTIAAIMIVLVLSASTSFIAQAAVPGDVLWPVKITIEKAEVALAVDSAREGRVHIRHVENRLRELSVIALKPDNRAKNDNISQLVRRLEKDITAASQSLKITQQEKQNTQPRVIMDLALDLNKKASEVAQALEKNKVALSVTTVQTAAQPTEESTEENVTATSTEDETETTTEAFVEEGGSSDAGSETGSGNKEVEQIITEVQDANETISLLAIRLMINLALEGNDDSEIKGILNSLINKRRAERQSYAELVELISPSFPVQKSGLSTIVKNSAGLLDTAHDLLLVGDLNGTYSKLATVRQKFSEAQDIKRLLIRANGILEPEVEEDEPVEPVVVPEENKGEEIQAQTIEIEKLDTPVKEEDGAVDTTDHLKEIVSEPEV